MLSAPNILQFSIPDALQPGNTHRMACYEWGDPAAKNTVLCVHGLTRNGRDFDYVARALEADYRVLCPDMPGRGQSEWLRDPAGYNYPNYVAEVTALIMQLGLTRLHWIGTSMGGIMGMMVASAMPGLIQTLVLNDIGTVVAAEGIRRIAAFAAENIVFDTRAEAEAAMRTRWSTFGIHDEAHWQHMFTYGLQEKDGKFRFAYDPAILAAYSKDRSQLADIKDLDLSGLWPAVTAIPTLLIRGETSDLLRRDTAQAMQSSHPNLTLHEIPNTGHAPALMDDKDTAVIRDWLRTHAAA